MPDDKRTIVIKVLRAMLWLYRGEDALRPAFVAKTDDDTWVCVHELLAALKTPTIFSDAYYLGAMTIGHAVTVHDAEKWHDMPHRRMFGLSVYPDYAQGALYALSASAAIAVPDTAGAYLRESFRQNAT